MPSRTSRHLAEHARYLFPKYFLLTSPMVFLHSACVYGSMGMAAGAGSDKRLGIFGLAAYVGVFGLVEAGGPAYDRCRRDV
jgi:hypothetical protein